MSNSIIEPDAVVMALALTAPAFSLGGVSVSPAPIPVQVSILEISIASANTIVLDAVGITVSLTAPVLTYVATLSPAPISVAIDLPPSALSIGGMVVGPNAVAIPFFIPIPSLFQGLIPSGGILYDRVEVVASVLFEHTEMVVSVPFDAVEMAQSF